MHTQILSLKQAAERAGIARRSLERLIANGEGPSVVHITTRRRGVLVTDLDAWLLSRRRVAPGAQTSVTGGAK
jgi:predicted DNA-binding transcriptional regulator AlpA